MREYAKKPENQSCTLDSNLKASKQASIDVILQRYKERNLQREERPNNTGLPDNLKAGIENLSGYSMDDVKVHYNSSKPTQLRGINVNDNEELEKEADMMGGSINLQFKEDTSLINHQQNKGNSVCQFVQRNVCSLQDTDDMYNEYTYILHGNGGALTPQKFADGLLASANPIFWYGNTPALDEQVEIMASANYLHEHKQNWQNELQQRQNNITQAQQPSWEKYQRAVAAQTAGEAIQPPWFLNPLYGYNIADHENIAFRGAAENELNNPAQNDPQQILGNTYDRDTNFSTSGNFAQQHTKILNNTSTYADCGGSVGCVLRLFDGNNMNAPHEVRLIINSVNMLLFGFEIVGTVIETPNFSNGGFFVGQPLTIRKSMLGITIPGKVVNYAEWCAQLVSPVYYNAVILAEDGLGIRYQTNLAQGRNRGAAVDLNDATMTTVRNRYDEVSDLSYRNSLGPERNKLNIQELGWDISVARYRRLGGDSIFTEAMHFARNPAQYSNLIQPPASVNVANPNWYYNSQEHNPDRFVGGRSNSTLLYLKTASILYHQNHLNLDECMDVMAFVIADMVVSGEHSMPECMTSVVMAARYSPPWNTTALNLAAAQQTINVWLHLINNEIKQKMYNKTKQSLINTVTPMDHLDTKLIKVLTALGKQLYNA